MLINVHYLCCSLEKDADVIDENFIVTPKVREHERTAAFSSWLSEKYRWLSSSPSKERWL